MTSGVRSEATRASTHRAKHVGRKVLVILNVGSPVSFLEVGLGFGAYGFGLIL